MLGKSKKEFQLLEERITEIEKKNEDLEDLIDDLVSTLVEDIDYEDVLAIIHPKIVEEIEKIAKGSIIIVGIT